MKKPSRAQARALRMTRDHGEPTYGLYGMSVYGGFHGTMRVLSRERWVRRRGSRWELTSAGVEALALVEPGS